MNKIILFFILNLFVFNANALVVDAKIKVVNTTSRFTLFNWGGGFLSTWDLYYNSSVISMNSGYSSLLTEISNKIESYPGKVGYGVSASSGTWYQTYSIALKTNKKFKMSHLYGTYTNYYVDSWGISSPIYSTKLSMDSKIANKLCNKNNFTNIGTVYQKFDLWSSHSRSADFNILLDCSYSPSFTASLDKQNFHHRFIGKSYDSANYQTQVHLNSTDGFQNNQLRLTANWISGVSNCRSDGFCSFNSVGSLDGPNIKVSALSLPDGSSHVMINQVPITINGVSGNDIYFNLGFDINNSGKNYGTYKGVLNIDFTIL